MKIFISGSDGHGWSIDQDRNFLEQAIIRLGGKLADTPFRADIVHNLWWNCFLHHKKYFYYLNRRVLLTASNFITNDMFEKPNEELQKALKLRPQWISPSSKQKKIFDKHNIRSHILPFQVSKDFFKNSSIVHSKDDYLEKLGIPLTLTKNRRIIGSFQRDTQGFDLVTPKPQKGPEHLIEILKEMPRDKYLLLLAGPRRHYVIKKCREHNIPFYYLGKENQGDDLLINAIDYKKMKDLYKAIDFYMVTSRSEGGPKAVLEGIAAETTVLSTDVGLVRDILCPENIFLTIDDYKKCVFNLINSGEALFEYKKSTINICKNKLKSICDHAVYDKQLANIYEKMMHENKYFI